MPEPLRVIIDPNVSGLINPYGAPADVVRAVMDRRVTALVTPHLIDELAGVLARPRFRRWIAPDDAAALLDALAAEADLRPDPAAPQQRLRDPYDDYLVALAEATGAVIVSGDKDLLDADLVPPAITPQALIEQLRFD